MPSKQHSFPLLVLGMHRSGTSLLAKLFHQSGIPMAETFLATRGGNPEGVYEDKRFVEFHEQLLSSEAGAEWPLCGMWWLRREAVKEGTWESMPRSPIPGGKGSDEPWGWKDPRTSLFIHYWRRQFPTLRGVVVYRHPADVYLSLLRRGDVAIALDPILAFEAYATYYEAILKDVRVCPEAYYLVRADDLIKNWEDTVDRLADWLSYPLNARGIRPVRDSFHPSAVGSQTGKHISRVCSRAERVFNSLERWLHGELPSDLNVSSSHRPSEPSHLEELEASLGTDFDPAERRRQLRIDLGKSLHEIGKQADFFEGKQRFYETELNRLKETVRVLEEQKSHLSARIAFMEENAGVEAWQARRSIMEMRRTLSWRITRPLRTLRSFAERGFRRLGRGD